MHRSIQVCVNTMPRRKVSNNLREAIAATRCHESGYHSLQLHITNGLHLPSCTAHTHSRPPLHQSHSCHHSLINPDCLTTPAPHSLTHIKAAHKHSPSAKSCFPLATFPSVFPSLSFCALPGLLTSSPDRLLPASLTSPVLW